uniref:Uncharacterized protein n=1 Tax=Cacopsylla melanoneura TaxID=428564 RepID=A0A8D8VEM2_9HEMI
MCLSRIMFRTVRIRLSTGSPALGSNVTFIAFKFSFMLTSNFTLNSVSSCGLSESNRKEPAVLSRPWTMAPSTPKFSKSSLILSTRAFISTRSASSLPSRLTTSAPFPSI